MNGGTLIFGWGFAAAAAIASALSLTVARQTLLGRAQHELDHLLLSRYLTLAYGLDLGALAGLRTRPELR